MNVMVFVRRSVYANESSLTEGFSFVATFSLFSVNLVLNVEASISRTQFGACASFLCCTWKETNRKVLLLNGKSKEFS